METQQNSKVEENKSNCLHENEDSNHNENGSSLFKNLSQSNGNNLMESSEILPIKEDGNKFHNNETLSKKIIYFNFNRFKKD